jgi:hypothetical protein
MSRLSKFLAEPVEVDINGEKIKIFPLKVKDLTLFQENPSKEDQNKINKEIIKRSLVEEELTDEDIDNLDIQTFTKIMDAVNKANGFTNEQVRAIKEKIAQTGAK